MTARKTVRIPTGGKTLLLAEEAFVSSCRGVRERERPPRRCTDPPWRRRSYLGGVKGRKEKDLEEGEEKRGEEKEQGGLNTRDRWMGKGGYVLLHYAQRDR